MKCKSVRFGTLLSNALVSETRLHVFFILHTQWDLIWRKCGVSVDVSNVHIEVIDVGVGVNNVNIDVIDIGVDVKNINIDMFACVGSLERFELVFFYTHKVCKAFFVRQSSSSRRWAHTGCALRSFAHRFMYVCACTCTVWCSCL